ncbi:hypothetical protein D3C75_1252840 [compost metagenome]
MDFWTIRPNRKEIIMAEVRRTGTEGGSSPLAWQPSIHSAVKLIQLRWRLPTIRATSGCSWRLSK